MPLYLGDGVNDVSHAAAVKTTSGFIGCVPTPGSDGDLLDQGLQLHGTDIADKYQSLPSCSSCTGQWWTGLDNAAVMMNNALSRRDGRRRRAFSAAGWQSCITLVLMVFSTGDGSYCDERRQTAELTLTAIYLLMRLDEKYLQEILWTVLLVISYADC